MVTIPGASGFINASTLANRQGIPAGQANVFGDLDATSLLDIGRQSIPGVGLSNNARALNREFLKTSSSNFNQLFSLGIGATATVEGLQQQILALRSGLSEDRLAPSLRAENDIAQDDGSLTAGDTGTEIDTEA